MNNKKSSRGKYVISFIVLILLIALTFYMLFKEYKIEDVKLALKLINLNYIYLAVFMLLGYLFFEALSMKVLLKKLGYKISIFKNIKYASVDVYFSAITPAALGGQPMVAYYMEKDKIPVSESSVVLLLNSIIFRLVLMLYGLIALILSISFLDTPSKIVLFTIGLSLNLFFVSLFLMALLATNLLLKIGNKVIRVLHKARVLKKDINIYYEKLQESIIRYKDAFSYLQKDLFLLIRVLMYNFIQRGMMFFIPYLVYRSFGLESYGFISLMAIQIFITITVDSLPIPGGVGIAENLMISFFGITYSTELIFPAMMVTRGLNFYLAIILTGSMILISLIGKKVKKGIKKIC